MKKVLVVDDSVFIYQEIAMMLDGTDYSVEGYAKTGEEALQVYEEIKPDVVTMDIILPEMDGFEATRKILEKWPQARVLVVSSIAYEDTIEESEESGAKNFIYKPFDRDVLIKALDKCME